MRQRYAYDANESTRRLVEGGMSTGHTNTPTARGFSVSRVHHSKAMHSLFCITSHYYVLHRFEIFSALELSRKALFGCHLAPSRLREAALWQLAC